MSLFLDFLDFSIRIVKVGQWNGIIFVVSFVVKLAEFVFYDKSNIGFVDKVRNGAQNRFG